MQLNYVYLIVFFDEKDNEVHRIDAESGLDRMTGSLQYVHGKAYERYDQFLQLRKENAFKKMNSKSWKCRLLPLSVHMLHPESTK